MHRDARARVVSASVCLCAAFLQRVTTSLNPSQLNWWLHLWKRREKAQREKKNKEEAGDSERSGGTTENYTDDKGATERQKWGSEA